MKKHILLTIGSLLSGTMAFSQTAPTANTAAQAPLNPSSQQSPVQDMKLSNEFIDIGVEMNNDRLTDVIFFDKINGKHYSLGSEVFSIALEGDTEEEHAGNADNKKLNKLSALNLKAEAPQITELKADPKGRRLADRRNGKKITIPFAWTKDGLSVNWNAELRDGVPYARFYVTVCSENYLPAPVRSVCVLDVKASNPIVQGTVKGSPVTAAEGRLFAGIEHPLGINTAENGKISARMDRKLDIPVHAPLTVSSVLGVSAPGQTRRTFQKDYINEERARPYGAFLNYNTWYDSFFDRYDEKMAMDVVKAYGEELVKKRGVVVDSFMMDDGWDDTQTLWKFNKGFPNEFKNIRKEAESFSASPGVWFSPWGGYGQPKDNRIKAAGGKFETNDRGFVLSGPVYYDHFKNMCLDMIRKNGINHFKFDGTSSEESQIPGSKFSSDFEAIISIINELRHERPDLYVNLTTGTWASPFWFGIADSIWRGNWDHSFIGEGTKRNKWITHRDAFIYANNVAKSPLFPVNSLMTHGVIFAKKARGLDKVENDDLTNEIWSGFGSGTQMQEIYVSPELLNKEQWDTLATAAKWARANNNTLVDTHWIGGDPAEMEVYGWASWSPEKGIITLRNPSGKEQQWSCDAAAMFELPVGAATRYKLSSPKGNALPSETMEAGKPITITLKPFEVIVLEATPEKAN